VNLSETNVDSSMAVPAMGTLLKFVREGLARKQLSEPKTPPLAGMCILRRGNSKQDRILQAHA
jgi:hypothetical protein